MISRSIRLFGYFKISDKKDFPSIDTPKIPFGVIELFQAEYELPGEPIYGTFLRWTKINDVEDVNTLSIPTNLELPKISENAFFKNFDVFKKLTELSEGCEQLSFWICNPSEALDPEATTKGRILFFSGAVVFDQFDSNDNLDRRFPCVPFYRNTTDDRGHSSRLVIGNGNVGYDYRVEIGLPIPAPFSNVTEAKIGNGRGALGVGGLYASALKTPEDAKFPIGILTGGSGETAYQANDGDHLIGDFGFSGDGHSPHKNVEFVKYAIGINSNPNMANGLGISAGHILSKLGFSGGVDRNSLAYNNIEFLSKRDAGNMKNGWTYSVVCRRRIRPLDIDMAEQLGVQLSISKSIDVEIGFQCTILNDDIAGCQNSDNLSELQCNCEVRLHWLDTHTLAENNLLGYSLEPTQAGDPVKIGFGGILEAARLMNLTRRSQLPLKSQPQSYFPLLEGYPNNEGTDVHEIDARFVAYVSNIDAYFKLGDENIPLNELKHPVKLMFDDLWDIDWISKSIPPGVANIGITIEPEELSKELQIFNEYWRRAPKKAEPLQLKAYFNGVNRIQPKSKQQHYHFQLTHDERAMGATTDGSVICYTLQNSLKQDIPHEQDNLDEEDKIHWGQFRSRLGSLDFKEHQEGAGLLDDESNIPNSLTIRRRDRSIYDERDVAQGQTTLDVELKMTLRIGDVRPVTVDVPHGDRKLRRADLLIDENPSEVWSATDAKKFEVKFLLSIDERLRDDQDWHLVARLYERNAEASNERRSFTVIGEKPFFVYRYSRLPLDSSGNSEQGLVAEYDSDQREWRYKKVSELYHFTFPPAVAGESADKPRRLEIHDPLDLNVHSPVVKLKEGDPLPPWEVTYLVDSRFSPPTDVWTKPEDLQRNYFLPEHAGRALFKQNGVFGPGMELAGLRGELLYAMPFGINVSALETATPRPRIAELEVLTGQMVMVEQRDNVGAIKKRWDALRETMLKRPQRLETWTLDPRRADPFVPAKFEKGLQFSLRRTALLKPPVPMEEDDQIATDKVAIAPPRLAEHGLAGGALWPLESRNYVQALRSQPQSTGGSLEKFALAPHGGSGDQTAEFLNGNVKIISETRNGFVQKQRVEIIGRIAALWHRAKHVIIYERTTSASAQFAPEFRADTRTKRPVLRKVDEFIEILEPVRRYPDFEGYDKKTSGFLEEVRFNSRVIRVNSAWGTDVGEIGWEIPLWNRRDAKIRPKVYPYPDIAFATLGEGGDERPLAIQECLDADNIFFFADAESALKTSDTDTWPSRDAIDFTSFCSVDYIASKVDAALLVEEAARRSAASRLLPGMRRFTWRLASATTATQINAGLGEKPIFSGLDTITYMRNAIILDASEETDLLDNAFNARLGKTQLPGLKAVESISPWILGNEESRPNFDILNNFDRDQNVFYDYVKGIVTFNEDEAKLELKKLRDKIDELKKVKGPDLLEKLNKYFTHGEITAEPGKIIESASDVIGKNSKFLKKLDEFDGEFCGRLEARIKGQINNRKLLLVEHSKIAQRELIDLVNTVDDLLPEDQLNQRKSIIRQKIVEELGTRVDIIFDQVRQDVGDAFESIEKARAIVDDWKLDAQSALRLARSRIDAWYSAYDLDKPWSPNRIKRAEQQLLSEIAAVEAEASAALEELRQRLSGDINSVAASLTTKISRIMAHVLAKSTSTYAQVGQIEGMLLRHVRPITSFLDKITNTKGSYNIKVQQVVAKINAKLPSLDSQAKADAITARDVLTNQWTQIQLGAGIANETLKSVKDSANGSLNEIKQNIKSSKKTVTTGFIETEEQIEKIHQAALELADQAGEEIQQEFDDLHRSLTDTVGEAVQKVTDLVSDLSFLNILDGLVEDTREWLDDHMMVAEQVSVAGLAEISGWLEQKQNTFETTADKVNDTLKQVIKSQVIDPATDAILDPISEQDWLINKVDLRLLLVDRLNVLADEIQGVIEVGGFAMGELNAVISDYCDQLAGFKASIWDSVETVKIRFLKELNRRFEPFLTKAEKYLSLVTPEPLTIEKLNDLLANAKQLEQSFNDLTNQVGEGAEYVRAYLDRAIDLVGSLSSGSFKAGPNNALKLYSAVFQSPEIGALRANMDRIRGTFQHVNDLVKTSKAKAIFEKLGDALKAMGLDLPFNELGDKFKLDESQLEKLSFSDIFGNFGGLDISQLVPDFGNAGGLSKYIDVTHDLDKKAARAWVKIDISVPIKGRRKLFSIGPFTLYFTDSILEGFVHLEASKDTEEVTTTDLGVIKTNVEAVVGGQVMVTLQDVQLVYTKNTGLDFVFDAKNIKLNPTFRFIQDTLGGLFGDELGGLKLIKQNGIPVGLEHVFKIPPISIMFGTSGVSNIQISNRFALIAYPEFVISDRFNLSTRELPFLFSIFIIGGTGYIFVETEYRPFDRELMVTVEAAAGGSASLAFAFGPVVGSVFISISIALSYQKRIGSGPNGGSGLTVSLVLVVAGNVSLWGMVNIYIGLMLTMNYHESGQIDGIGSLSVQLRISKWFKLKYKTMVRYKLRNGQATKQVTSSTELGGEKFTEIKQKAAALNQARKAL